MTGQLYKIASYGDLPLAFPVLSAYLRDPDPADEPVITGLQRAVVKYAEDYTSVDFRQNVWQMLQTGFTTRLCVLKTPVNAFEDIIVERLVDGDWVEVDSSTYYLVEGMWHFELVELSGQSWPTDADDREQNVRVSFQTLPWGYTLEDLDEDAPKLDPGLLQAVKQHTLYLYENRGDTTVQKSADESGATLAYDTVRKAEF